MWRPSTRRSTLWLGVVVAPMLVLVALGLVLVALLLSPGRIRALAIVNCFPCIYYVVRLSATRVLVFVLPRLVAAKLYRC